MLELGTILWRLLFSAIISGAFGLERELLHKDAGLRTTVLVGMGSTLSMVVSLSFDLDPARIAAGVITGIGFLGAGLIIQDRKEVHGISTAATIWMVAALGLAIGVGFYAVSIFVTLVSLVVLHYFGHDRIRKMFGIKKP